MTPERPAGGERTIDGSVVALCGVLIVSLLALAWSTWHVLHESERQFDRAAASQTQLADVSQIAAVAHDGDPVALRAALDRYIGSIAAETRLVGIRGDQREELAMASRLRMLARDPTRRSEMRTLVATIGARERAEAAEVAAQMVRLRARTSWLTAGLTIVAMCSAVLGTKGLLAVNRRLSREVAARTADIAAIDRSRRLFFATASHEMRTPVTVMRGEAEVTLADERADIGQLRTALMHVVANAEFLDHRIEELLGLARAEDGRFVLERNPVDLSATARRVGASALAYARSGEIGIVLDIAAVPLIVRGDDRWIGQAMLATLDNAVKFSTPGDDVVLSVRRDGDVAVVEIADRGIGVVAEALPRVFDAYYQAEAGRARGGTGLGLALARWVVEQHGGTIRAVNRPGGGCTIAIAVPLAVPLAA